MFITGLGIANPPQRYAQAECWDALNASPQLDLLEPRSRAILRKVLTGNNGIATRHLAFDRLEEAFQLDPDTLHARFVRVAPAIASQAAERALAASSTRPVDIDAVLISTCTGYLCPGLTSYLAERLGLRADLLPLDLVGLGCAAALPNLRTAESLLASGRCRRVLSICAEVCSAAFYLDDDPGVLISACLFGDGAAAAVLSNEPASGPGAARRIQWRMAGSHLETADREQLRFEQKNGMLRNILRPEVPALAGKHARAVLDSTLARAGVEKERVCGWIFHPGGRDVLASIAQQLQLPGEELRWSAGVLRDFGNMSSPSVLFALQRAIEGGARPGLWWMSSFGAGFCCHGALIEVT